MSAETEKSNGLQTTMSPGRLLRILLARVKPYTPRVAVLVVTLLVEGVFNVLLALSLKLIIDYAFTPRDPKALTLILAALGVGYLLTAASQVVRDYL